MRGHWLTASVLLALLFLAGCIVVPARPVVVHRHYDHGYWDHPRGPGYYHPAPGFYRR